MTTPTPGKEPGQPAAPGRSRHDPTDGLGIALALGAAMCQGLAIALARFAYEGGTNGLTLASTRACVAVLVLLILCKATGRRLRVSVRDWLHLSGLGILISVVFYGNVGAVEYIPVGLTALLVFTYPLIIGLLEAVIHRRLPAPAKLLALMLAFVGVFLMLGVSLESSDPFGIALALSAGVAAAVNAMWYARTMHHLDNLVATLHMTVAAMVSVAIVATINGDYVLPHSASGWGGFWAVVMLQSLGAPAYFAGIKRIGPLNSGMISNLQPLTSIVAALLLFGELLSAAQLLGGGMILLGIGLMQRYDAARMARRRGS